MPLALLFALAPTAHLVLPGLLGREAQAWFLGQVAHHDAELAKRLHAGSGPRPYTVSGIVHGERGVTSDGPQVKAGGRCWLRVTTLNEEMSNAVQEDILPHLPQSLTLRGIEFRIEAYTLDPADHPWAGQATYGELVQGSKGYSRYVTLEFASPTAFRSEGADIALPVPSHVFRGYWQKWNAFAPEPLCIDETWPQFAAACVMVNMLENLHTEKVYFADGTRGAVVGFEGKAGFALLSQKQCGEWAAIWEGASQVLQTLARFAFYCGTGHHTTTGLGQTRLVAGAGDKVKR